MLPPNCPDHDALVHELALGRLDDADALEAEETRQACPVCRSWWEANISAAADSIDAAVGETFDAFTAPRRSRHGWLAVAAVAVLAIAAGVMWLADGPGAVPVSSQAAVISAVDFEDGALGDALVIAESGAPEPARPAPKSEPPDKAQALFEGGFESGDASSWTPNT